MAVEIIKVQLDADTKGAEQSVDSFTRKVKTSVGEFENLNEAISKTQDALGTLDPKTKEFKVASKELSQLKDRLKETEAQSLRFTEALSKQPGVIGLVGQSLEGLRGTIKVFMANPIIAVVAGLSAAFLALRESLTRTEEGQAKLTKITEGLEKIMNGLFAIIEPIAMQFADLVGSLFENEKVMDGLSKTVGVLTGVFTGLFGVVKSVGEFIINVLVNNFKTLIGVAKGAGDVIAGVFTFDWDRIKEGATAAFDAVKEGVTNQIANVKELAVGVGEAVVSGYEAGEKGFKEGFSRLTKAGKEEKKKLDEQAKKDKEDAAKQALADAEAAAKIQLEAELSLLDEKERALIERQARYDADKLALKKAGITDFLALDAEYALDKAAIEQTAQDKIDAAKKVSDDELKAGTLAKLDFAAYMSELLFAEQQQSNQATYQDELHLFDKLRDLGKQKLIANEATADEIAAYDKETQIQRTELAEAQEEERLGIISNALGGAAQLFGEHTAAAKALSISQAIIDTYSGANKALGAYPPPFNFIAAGAVIAGGLANVKKIIGTKQPKLPGGRTISEANVNAPSFSAPAGLQAPQIQSNVGQTPGTQIAQTINRTQDKPIKAYVVSTDVSSNQALDRRTNGAATFSG